MSPNVRPHFLPLVERTPSPVCGPAAVAMATAAHHIWAPVTATEVVVGEIKGNKGNGGGGGFAERSHPTPRFRFGTRTPSDTINTCFYAVFTPDCFHVTFISLSKPKLSFGHVCFMFGFVFFLQMFLKDVKNVKPDLHLSLCLQV